MTIVKYKIISKLSNTAFYYKIKVIELKMSKKSILYGITISFIGILCLGTLSVKANNPTGLDLTYDSTTGLRATITHGQVSSGHFIEFVNIEINGSLVLNTTYTSQATNTISYDYVITASQGDVIRVTAICSISGSITRTLTIGSGQGDPVVDDTIPGYLGMMIFISAFIFVTSLIIHKKIKKK